MGREGQLIQPTIPCMMIRWISTFSQPPNGSKLSCNHGNKPSKYWSHRIHCPYCHGMQATVSLKAPKAILKDTNRNIVAHISCPTEDNGRANRNGKTKFDRFSIREQCNQRYLWIHLAVSRLPSWYCGYIRMDGLGKRLLRSMQYAYRLISQPTVS